VGVLDRFEGSVEDAFDKAGARVFKGTLEPAQIARRAEKQMKRERLVGAGKQHAPTLYTVLVSAKDDRRLFHFYPTMASEIETYLLSRGADAGLSFDGRPLVRFIVDKNLKSGRFDVIAENVAAPIIRKLREEEAEYLGLQPSPDLADPVLDLEVLSSEERLAPAVGGKAAIAEQAELAAVEALVAERVVEQDELSELAAPAALLAAPAPAMAAPPATPAASPADLRSALREAHGDLVEPDPATSSEQLIDEFFEVEPAIGDASLIDHSTGNSYALLLNRMSIGRGSENDIVLNDGNASRRHAQLHQNVLGKWKVVDLNSTNGTLVNGRPTEQTILRDHDELTIGVTILEFQAASER